LREIERNGVTQLAEDARKRLSEKVERVKEVAQKWADSGRDPSPIGKIMSEKIGPLIEAGKPIEAEAELDHLLEKLAKDAK
jgi:hypothetical protein